jgi:integrase/recombinase XerD
MSAAIISHTANSIDLTGKIAACIEAERARKLSGRSIAELLIHLGRFNDYCRMRRVEHISRCDAAFLKDFIMHANPSASPAQGKAIVWSLRKLFGYLTLWQDCEENPAHALSHPKISSRRLLPDYLNASQLRTLMEYVGEHGTLADMTIVSLLATVGARPKEICMLRRTDVHCGEQFVFLRVKGNWFKRTPISLPMAELLDDYVASITHASELLFLNQWRRSLDSRYIQRLLKHFAAAAGLGRHITPNTLRHTFATYAADRHGVVVTRALLGHCAESHATDVYMHLAPSKFRALMNCHPYQTTVRRRKK